MNVFTVCCSATCDNYGFRSDAGGPRPCQRSGFLWIELRIQYAEMLGYDKAIEQLQAAQAEWSRCQGHAVQIYQDVDDAIHEYAQVTGKTLIH